MTVRVWTPIKPDGTIDEAELRRLAETAEPTRFEVVAGANGLATAALVPDLMAHPAFGSTLAKHTFVVPLNNAVVTAHWYMWPNVTIAAGPISTQAEADRVLPALLKVKAVRREAVFAPTEPVDLAEWIFCDDCREGPYGPGAIEDRLNNAMGGKPWRECGCSRLDAVRVRGGAPEHVASLRAQCEAAGVEFSEEA